MSTASTVSQRVSSADSGFFAASDFDDLPRTSVEKHLERLVHRGDLLRVRHGLYYKGQRYTWGMARPDERSIVERIVGTRGVGPSGLSAANELGFTTQVPARATYAVTGPKPRDLPTARFVSRQRLGRRDHHLTWNEIALLEVLDAWDGVVDASPAEARGLLSTLMTSGAVSAERLALASSTEPARTRGRLRDALFTSGFADQARRVPRAARPRPDLSGVS